MKPYSYRFENVLTYRELEKNETETEFKKSVEDFETAATKLYELLKKKEETLAEQQNQMEIGFSIEKMHHYIRFIDSIEKKIEEQQQQVIEARSKMNWFEEKLLEKSLEVKKFEKMKEKDKEQYEVEMEQLEAERLDELSTLKFRNGKVGW